MTTGLLVLRIVLGLLLVGHGTQKLFGLFGGAGLDATAGFFHSVGFRPGRQMAIVAGASEATAGTLFVLGLLTPLASAIVIGTLVVAGSVHWAAGLWGHNGGFELPLVYVTAAAALAFTGPGDASLDHAIGLDGFSGAWGIAAVVLGAGSALAVVARARRAVAADAAATVETERVPA